MNTSVARRRRLPHAAIFLAAALCGAAAAPAAVASPAKPEQPGLLKILVPLSTAAVPFLLLAALITRLGIGLGFALLLIYPLLFSVLWNLGGLHIETRHDGYEILIDFS